MERKRESWVDILKGIAIIFVVLGHVVTSYRNSNLLTDAGAFNYVGSFAYAFHMPLFFAISGYLAGKSKKRESLGASVLRKCISYGIPYVVFSVIAFVLKALAGTVVNDQITVTDLMMIWAYPISSLWFIYALLIASILSLLLKHRGVKRPLILVIGLLLNVLGNVILNTGLLQGSKLAQCILFDAMKYYFWYALGEYLADKLNDEVKEKLEKIKTWKVFLGLCVYAGVVYIASFRYEIKWMFLSMLISCCGIELFLLVAMKISESRILEYLGKQTFPIYLMHGYVVSFVRVLLSKLHIPVIGGFVPLILATVLGVALPLAAYVISTKIRGLDFIFYPQRYLRVSEKEKMILSARTAEETASIDN